MGFLFPGHHIVLGGSGVMGGVVPLAPPPAPVRWPWAGCVTSIPLPPFRNSVGAAFPSFVFGEVLSVQNVPPFVHYELLGLVCLMLGKHGRTCWASIKVHMATKEVLSTLLFVIVYTACHSVPITFIPSSGHSGWGYSCVF